MTEDHAKLAESVRSGRYFEEARSWYRAVYLSPVSGRTMFLLVAVLAGLVGLFAVISLSSLLPLVSHRGIIIPAHGRMDEAIPRLIPLKAHDQDPNEAVTSFLVQQFVASAETWVAGNAQGNAQFVKAHASEEVYNDYIKRTSPLNPQSFAAMYPRATRRISMDDADIDTGKNSGTARIRFTTSVEGTTTAIKSEWTAKLEYNYTALSTDTVVDEKTGDEELKVTDPQFQVVRYVVKEGY